MNRLKRNPLLQVAKCEMCPNVVTNFVTGLCGRCSFMWTNKRNLIRATLGPYQLMAATVSMVRGIQDRQPMHPTFSQAIETIRSLRKQKVELFQKLRSHFLDSILIEQSYDQPVTTIVEDDYWNVPEIYDSDYIMFQHQIDLLGGVTRTLSANSDLNNNKVKEK